MIPREAFGELKIPSGRRFGIIPRYHKAVLYLTLDSQPKPDDSHASYVGEITVHGWTPYLGTLCDGTAKIDWKTRAFEFQSNSVEFSGSFEPKSRTISGTITLDDADNLHCENLPIIFQEFDEEEVAM